MSIDILYDHETFNPNGLENYETDQLVICREKFLAKVEHPLFLKDVIKKHPRPKGYQDERTDRYPNCNSYYHHTEEVDAYARAGHLMASAASPTSGNSSTKTPRKFHYSTRAAQIEYLSSKPLSVLVLGKPSIGEQQFAKQLADYRKSVCIDPEILILEEIASGSRTGTCIEFNLRNGKAIGSDVLLKLAKKRIESEAVQHRGFVLCGFPLIPNNLYEDEHMTSDSAILTVMEMFDELLDRVYESKRAATPHPEIYDVFGSRPHFNTPRSSMSLNVNATTTVVDDTTGPFDLVMNLFEGPTLIVYMVSENADVINRRSNYRYDIYSNSIIDVLKEQMEMALFQDAHFPYNHLNLFKSSWELIHLVKLPNHFPCNVQTQLENYYKFAAESIEARIVTHDPEYFVKVDARASVASAIAILKSKLKVINEPPVLIPKRFDAVPVVYKEGGGEAGGEEGQEILESNEDAFKRLCLKDVVAPAFKWEWSEWGSRCPVAMASGSYVLGSSKFAVQFMDRIFFLSSAEAWEKFRENPRRYLLPPNPRSHGKFYVIGPPASGRTAAAKCLGYLLGCEVLSMKDLTEEYIEKKRESLMESLRQQAIENKLKEMNADALREYESTKRSQQEKVSNWLDQFRLYIVDECKKRRNLRNELSRISSFPQLKGTKVETYFEGIYLTDATAIDLLKFPDKMKNYLPKELRTEISDFVPITELDESIRVEDLLPDLNEKVISNYALGDDDLWEIIVTAIKNAEEKYFEKENCRGGWIVDGLPTDFNFFRRVFEETPPEHVVLLDDSSNGSFLSNHFMEKWSKFKHFREFFQTIGKDKIAETIPEVESQVSLVTSEEIVRGILHDLMARREFLVEPEDPPDISESAIFARRQSVILYMDQYKQFMDNKKEIIDFVQSKEKDLILIDVNEKKIAKVLEEIIITMESKYKLFPEIFTDMDRLKEAHEYGGNIGQGGETEDAGTSMLDLNRRYGNTFYYCPVTYHDRWVLWRGKEEHIVKFQGKLHLLSSPQDLEQFFQDPPKYLPMDAPVFPFPPPRVCIVGHNSTGKTTICKAVSNNFALTYAQHDASLINSEEFVESLWFEEPIRSRGFVVDNFPKNLNDFFLMIDRKAIPDLILILTNNKKNSVKRSVERGIQEWRKRVQEENRSLHGNRIAMYRKWEEERKQRFDDMMEERRAQRFASKKGKKLDENKETAAATDGNEDTLSQVTFDSVAEKEDLDEVIKLLDEELPEPIFEQRIEDLEDVTDRLTISFEKAHDLDTVFFQEIKESCAKLGIPCEEIDSEKNVDANKYGSFVFVHKYSHRNRSFFERTYDVSMEMAEKLIECGYYFLSIFGRTCPVQYRERKCAVQLFIPAEQMFEIFPLIHRHYVYFLVGREARQKFVRNPLKYADIADFEFPLIPFRLAVIGPPKSGKTTLAARFQVAWGLKVITKGQAIRHVLSYFPYSDLFASMEGRLRKGLTLKEKLALRCVEASTYDPRASTQGFVMDGFPNTPREVKYLASMGLMPHLVIDLRSDDPKIGVPSDSDGQSFRMPIGRHLLEYRLELWKAESGQFRSWLDREYQNLVGVTTDVSLWDKWETARDFANAALWEIKHYYGRVKDGWPLRLSYMLVCPLEFLERQSTMKNFCPVCLNNENCLKSGGFPPDRTGLVHFRDFFYYVCPEHMDEFLEVPGQYLPPYSRNKLPYDIPERCVNGEPSGQLYESGYCAVCYNDNILGVPGKPEFSCVFNQFEYHFDKEECLRKFMSNPLTYCNVRVTLKTDRHFPPLTYKNLPPLGMLEQFVAKDIIKAIDITCTIRPVVPCLSIKQSALLTVGMYMKINNPRETVKSQECFVKAVEMMQKRRKLLLRYLEVMHKFRNPHIHYEEPVPALEIPRWVKESFNYAVPSWSYTQIEEHECFLDKK